MDIVVSLFELLKFSPKLFNGFGFLLISNPNERIQLDFLHTVGGPLSKNSDVINHQH